MKLIISIISDDILFPHLFVMLLKRKIEDIEINVYKTFRDMDESQKIRSSNLVIIDGGMSRISSIEVIQQIRIKHRIIASIWFFTEIESEAYIHKSKEMGVNVIVSKPFDPHKITDDIALQFSKTLRQKD